jgi:isoleucyl-tRNA synthetase
MALLGHILRQLAIICAPFVPFLAEDIWLRLGGKESIHLADWPMAKAEAVDTRLEEQMQRVREFITAGLAIRKEQGIKVRQPLASATVPAAQPLHGDLEALVLEELNVKKVIYDTAGTVQLDTHIGSELRAEGFAREVMRMVQDMRKDAGLQVGDKAYGQWYSEDQELTDAIIAHSEMIARETGLSAFVRQPDDKTLTVERNTDLAPGKALWLGIRK